MFVGGGTGETPVRAGSAEQLLAGARVDEDVISTAAAAAQTDVDPISDHRASKAYRSAMVKVLTEKALRKAIARFTDAG